MPFVPLTDFDEHEPARLWLDFRCGHSLLILASEQKSYERVGDAYCERCREYTEISGYRSLGEAKR